MTPPPVEVKAKQVSQRVYYVEGIPGMASPANQGFNSNAGFVVTDDGVVVVDALGSYLLGKSLIAEIRRLTNQPIRRVILTHYHADHFYGLAAFKEVGAEVWANVHGREYLENQGATVRLDERRRDLAPWVDQRTQLVWADRWLSGDIAFTLGGQRFEIVYMGPAHAPDDEMVVIPSEHVIFSGDIMTTGRVPYVGDGDSRHWVQSIDRLLAMHPGILIPGHGPVSRDPVHDLAFTRDYLVYLRQAMAKPAADMVPFDEAYAKTDWSRYAHLPAFEPANRINAYGTYLRVEQESLEH